MGGVFGGGSAKSVASQPMADAAAEEKKAAEAKTQATQAQEEAGAKMRGAKRRGRQLLSDARLNPEMGMKETLGGGNSLG
jgi:hypothetical protein